MSKFRLFFVQLSVLVLAQLFILQLSSVSAEEHKSTDNEVTTLEDVKKKLSEAFTSITRFSADQRDQAAEAARRDLAQLDRQIDKLDEDQMNRKWDQLSEETRQNWRKTRGALKKKRVEAAEWYGGVKRGSVDAWDEIKRGYDKAFSELNKAWQKAREDFTTEEKKEESNTI